MKVFTYNETIFGFFPSLRGRLLRLQKFLANHFWNKEINFVRMVTQWSTSFLNRNRRTKTWFLKVRNVKLRACITFHVNKKQFVHNEETESVSFYCLLNKSSMSARSFSGKFYIPNKWKEIRWSVKYFVEVMLWCPVFYYTQKQTTLAAN